MAQSDKPFDWPEIHIPQQEELGLTREWPPVAGAPPRFPAPADEKERFLL